MFYHFLDLDPLGGSEPSEFSSFFRNSSSPLVVPSASVNEVNATHKSVGLRVEQGEHGNSVTEAFVCKSCVHAILGNLEIFLPSFLKETRLQACYYNRLLKLGKKQAKRRWNIA